LIIGNQNNISYKEIFQLIKENKIWLGTDNGGTKWFQVPPHYDIKTEARIKVENGVKYFSMGNIAWFTSLDHKRRHEKLILFRKYTAEKYPHYDNYDAIEVGKVTDIPEDWDGAMGVPITFLDKYNPEQFEILGCDYSVKEGLLPELIKKGWKGKIDRAYINGDRMYARILIKKRK
jgi:hypothetical protein